MLHEIPPAGIVSHLVRTATGVVSLDYSRAFLGFVFNCVQQSIELLDRLTLAGWYGLNVMLQSGRRTCVAEHGLDTSGFGVRLDEGGER